MRSLEMDGVEGALRGADTAADAGDRVDDGGAAAQAAGGLDLDLLFGEALFVLFEGLGGVDTGDQCGFLSLGVVIGINSDVVLVELEEVSVLTGQSQGAAGRADEAVQGLCGLMAFTDGVDDEGRTVVDVAADEDVGYGSLIGERGTEV